MEFEGKYVTVIHECIYLAAVSKKGIIHLASDRHPSMYLSRCWEAERTRSGECQDILGLCAGFGDGPQVSDELISGHSDASVLYLSEDEPVRAASCYGSHANGASLLPTSTSAHAIGKQP